PVHVVQAKGVRLLLPDPVRLILRVGPRPSILAQCALVVAEGKPRRGPRTASIFPLRLGRQTVAVAASNGDRAVLDSIARFPALAPAQLVAETDPRQAGDSFNRQVTRSLEAAGGLAHYRLVLALCHFVDPQVEGPGDPDLMLGFFTIPGTLVRVGRAHPERAR